MDLKSLNTGISKIEEIPVTPDSYPFTSALRYCDFEAAGYTEKEYYMYGTASVYQTAEDGSIEVKNADVPYINRFVVRMPEKSQSCSGNAVVEILNPSSSMDIERMWILGHKKFMRDGDIYVGITSKPFTLAKLKEFNRERYGRLRWNNPTPEIPFSFTGEDLIKQGIMLSDCNMEYETGLFWDMLSDLAVLLRSGADENPLKDVPDKKLILTGWSQSGDYLIRYLNDFAYREKRDIPLFDGYLSAGAPRHCPTPVNQYEILDSAKRDRVQIKKALQPCMVLQTESENAQMGAAALALRDGDEPDYQVRHYDIAGASHDTKYTLLDYYQDDPDLERIGMKFTYPGKDSLPNNYPTQYVAAAMFRNLFLWVRTGMAPARAPRIEVTAGGDNRKDVLGNSIGGVRTCFLDVPTAAYYRYSIVENAGTKSVTGSRDGVKEDGLFGHEEPFSPQFLKELYGDLKHYEDLVRKNTFTQVARGYLLKEDAEEFVQLALKTAHERGL